MPKRFRMLVVLAALFAACLATAQPMGGPPREPPMRQVQVAPGSFDRGTPVPEWVQRVPPPPTTRTEPLVARLLDQQIRLNDAGVASFAELALQANAATALGAIGQIKLNYVPGYQKVHLHSIGIWRDGAFVDRTSSANIRFLERETGFEQGVYSGVITVAILIPDVRVGDTLHYAVSFEGSNPVFGQTFAWAGGWEVAEPVEWRRVILTYPRTRTIQWRIEGDYRKLPVEPRSTQDGAMMTLAFDERGVEPMKPEPFVPDNFLAVSRLQFSEYVDWNEVARWAQSLFPPVLSQSDELKSLIAQFATQSDAGARAGAALRWVQGEVRNFALALGESSHRPHAPEIVLQRRFGDCKDKTYLLLTMLRSMGIEATPMLVSLSAGRLPGRFLPMPAVFDHAIVQARIDGAFVYLDPTDPPDSVAVGARWAVAPQTLGLLAVENTQGLVEVGFPPQAAMPGLEVEERIRIPALAPEGTIEARVTFVGARASLMRLIWSQSNADQRREVSLGYFGRRYSGIELAAAPEATDDPQLNRFTITGRYRVPRLAQSEGGNWIVRFEPWAIRGAVNLPETERRRYPIVAAESRAVREYKAVVEWPSQVSAIHDARSEVVDGLVFRGESRTSFRGNRFEYSARIATTATEIQASQVPRLIEDFRKFVETFEYQSVVRPGDVGAALAQGMSPAQATAVARARDQIDRATSDIRDKKLAGDELVGALCRRARGLAYLDQQADGLRDTSEAVRIVLASPDAWACHGDLLYASGDFAGAEEALTKALALGADETETLQDRGRSRVYAGRLDDAAADFARAAAAASSLEKALYARLWQMAALLRAGRPLPTEILELAGRDPTGAWPRPAVAMLAGVTTPQAMWAEVGRLDGNDRVLASEEAWFYLGQHYLAKNQPAEARKAFEECRALGIVNYVEHTAARLDLARLVP